MGAELLRTVAARPDRATNTMLVGTDAPVSAARAARGRCAACPRRCGRPRGRPPARLAPPLRGRRVYTDDKAPVEWLIDKSIVQVAARGER